MKLSEIINREVIAIDTNVLIYANQQKSQESIQLLFRQDSQDIDQGTEEKQSLLQSHVGPVPRTGRMHSGQG